MIDTTLTASRFTPHVVRAVRPDEIGHVADTLAEAFVDDPLFAWCVPDPVRRAVVLPSFFRLAVGAVAGRGEITVVADGGAAALWLPPGTPAVPDDEAFGTAVGTLLGDDSERTFALMALLDEVHPTEPHRFLWFIGARPAARGEGRGSALLRDVLVRSDAAGVPAYLDATSEANRRLYARHGFDVVGRRTIADSPPMWSMWRSPRAPG